MRTEPSLDYMRDVSPLLGIDSRNKSDSDMQILYWKALYEHLAAHVGQLHRAFERLMTADDSSPQGAARRDDDMALFLDQFITGQPFDLIAHLRASRPATDPASSTFITSEP